MGEGKQRKSIADFPPHQICASIIVARNATFERGFHKFFILNCMGENWVDTGVDIPSKNCCLEWVWTGASFGYVELRGQVVWWC